MRGEQRVQNCADSVDVFLRDFGGYSVCPNMCSGSQSHDLQQMVEQKAD